MFFTEQTPAQTGLEGVMRLFASTVLCVFAIFTSFTVAEARRSYTIKSGDTPDGIRLKFAPTLEDLRAANLSINFNLLQVGDEIVDPRPERSDLEESIRKIGDLTSRLESVTVARDQFERELKASRTSNKALEAKNAELSPLAVSAERYRDRFTTWVGILSVGLVCALLSMVWQRYTRGSLDREIAGLQKEKADLRTRIQGRGIPLDFVAPDPKVKVQPRTTGDKKIASITSRA
ncbi:MAG: LysM peptidoglycan-binding domain-containing protein [Candidatus Ryanbacteria bacterium]|nr:LysM peptidoglycan-binding domain-containing protein [Candidatus Ryanbacteria bacterium]